MVCRLKSTLFLKCVFNLPCHWAPSDAVCVKIHKGQFQLILHFAFVCPLFSFTEKCVRVCVCVSDFGFVLMCNDTTLFGDVNCTSPLFDEVFLEVWYVRIKRIVILHVTWQYILLKLCWFSLEKRNINVKVAYHFKYYTGFQNLGYTLL